MTRDKRPLIVVGKCKGGVTRCAWGRGISWSGQKAAFDLRVVWGASPFG